VDLFSTEGIQRAGSLKLAQSLISDIILTPFLKDASTILFPPQTSSVTSQNNQIDSTAGSPAVSGRLLVLFRDPIQRALNRYEETRILTGNDILSLTEYASNPIYSENNPLTRDLLGLGPGEALEEEQVKAAQSIIESHVLVGLYDELKETIQRWEVFLHWFVPSKSSEAVNACPKKVQKGFENSYQILSNFASSDPVGFNLLVSNHMIDLTIYKFARSTFKFQGQYLPSVVANSS
jgi:hypothetical protein